MKPERKLLAVFLGVALAPASLAAWLALRLFQQDVAMETERLRELRDRYADQAVQSLSRRLAEWEDTARKLPPGSVHAAGATLAYLHRQLPEAPQSLFAEGEEGEFRAGKSEEAIAIYRPMTKSPTPETRAGAWLRLGRVLRRTGRHAEAIQAFRQLSLVPNVSVEGAPASAAGRWAICSLLEKSGATSELLKAAKELRDLLDSAPLPASRAVYETYAEDAARWSATARPVLREALADAAAAKPAGRGSAVFRQHLITWLCVDNRTVLLPEEAIAALLPRNPVRIRFAANPASDELVRRPADTGLPWPIAVSLANPDEVKEAFSQRRSLLLALMAVMGLLMLAGGYLAWRLIRRELALGQMQADLVAAVSHEFRTPLTAMRQASTALREGRVVDESTRQAFYHALSRATERLHRLVEALLDFRRMDAEAMTYNLQPSDLSALVEEVTREFAPEAADQGIHVHAELPDHPVPVEADTEALARALWNLLDNAVKYRGESREVKVSVSRNGSAACLRVADKGIGIPESEQREVFRKFYRGEASRRNHIRGTGIGLAMVAHIVRGHGGQILLDSRPGEGTTFTIRIPLSKGEESNGAHSGR
ncbi:MAG: hypothetical protein HY820_30620 [Acidobacteria bacterium]|nr:hypothetical protein [Acidobacteriota bacterium]